MKKSLALSVPILVLVGGLAFAAQPSSLATTNHWLMSDVYKAPVYGPTHKKIGEIDDLILASSGQINTAVVGVGGFLGVGQKDVAIPFSDLKIGMENGKHALMLNRTKDQLKSAPAYQKTAMK